MSRKFFSPKLLQNQWVIVSISITLTLLVLILGLLVFNIKKTDRLYIIHYKAITGIDLFGRWWDLYFFWLVGFLLFVFHIILTALFWDKLRVLSYFLLFITPILEIIIFIAVYHLIGINR